VIRFLRGNAVASLYLPPVLWSALIFAGSSFPADRLPNVLFVGADKLIHFVLFLVLCFLAHRAFLRQSVRTFSARNALVLSIGITMIYGISDEAHQIFVPGRSAEFPDLVADWLGAFAYGGFFLLQQRAKRQISRPGPNV